MKHLFFYSLFAVLALLASCSEYDLGYTPEQIGYNITFRKDFGDYDMANDFNLAQRGQVTVTPTACPEVSIYSKSATGWQLVAKYDDVTGTRELGFDIPKGTKEILVSNGCQTQKTIVGGSVSFFSTRAGKYDKDDSSIKIELNEGQRYTYYYYDAAEALSFNTILPEGKPNKDKAIDDFTLVSTGEFIIYPTYWNAALESCIGIYFFDENGNIVKNVLFGNHAYNECVQMLTDNGDWETLDKSDKQISSPGIHPTANMLAGSRASHSFRSKGIIVNLPVGTKFGFYTPVGGNYYNRYAPRNCFSTQEGYPKVGDKFGVWWHDGEPSTYESGWMDAHSESNLNPPDVWTEVWTAETYMNNTRHAVMFGLYFDSRGDMVVGAEDMYAYDAGWKDYSDYDLNDRVFKIYGSQPEVLNNKSQSWILPFEDLGGSFDWDFNDVILKMDYVSGQKTAKITPIAAGGTLHSEVFFNDTDDESKVQDLGEIHVLLGADPVGEDELYASINASHRGTPGTIKTVNITDPANFSIANAQTDANSSANGTSTKSMVGAYVVTKGGHGMSTIAYNGMGKAPAMLVLPTTYQIDDTYYEWAWPVENKDIRAAYGEPGHSFDEWVADHTKAQDWYMYPTGGTVEERSSSSFIHTLVPSPEYDMDDYGTIISLPSKNSQGVYAFPASLFSGATEASVTVVLKGVKKNALYAYDGTNYSSALGTWTRLNGSGTITVMGNTASGSGTGNVNYEGMYQIILGSSDLSTIASAGQWVVSAGDDTQILYIAYKNSTNGGTPSDPQAGQPEEPGSSNDPANGSEPVLAPIR